MTRGLFAISATNWKPTSTRPPSPVVDALCVFTDLLIEITRPGSDVEEKPKAARSVPEMLTTEQAAEYLGLKPIDSYELEVYGSVSDPLCEGRLGKTRYQKADLEKFLQQRDNRPDWRDGLWLVGRASSARTGNAMLVEWPTHRIDSEDEEQ